MKFIFFLITLFLSLNSFAQSSICSPTLSGAGCDKGQSVGDICGWFNEGLCTATKKFDPLGLFECLCARKEIEEVTLECFGEYTEKTIVKIYDHKETPDKSHLVIPELSQEKIEANATGALGGRFPKIYTTTFNSKKVRMNINAGTYFCSGWSTCKRGTLQIDDKKSDFYCPTTSPYP